MSIPITHISAVTRARALSVAIAATLAGASVPASAAFFQIAENNEIGRAHV